ncbi:protein apterous isoform X2 [Drosophila bipectinata]|uniref:protein apterous isoform X2 n=1 Tax=Drosophila bipectinata TaxID=42026 RepID=UPI0007E5D12B|nr:protein apterous isoform X2 [Drosophila bipectinata]
MGVCTEERPVMHWQQSARFLGPGAREKSPTPPVAHQGSNHCGSAAGASTNHPLFRTCSSSSCPDICDHSTKPFGNAYNTDSFRRYETADRATFEDSTAKFSISRSRTDCTEISDETTSGISFKTEPFGPPSSPESTNDSKITRNLDECAGCGRQIQDRFYLSAVEKRWHASCLQCYACRQPLERESSCYSRDGNIYCKNDYYRTHYSIAREGDAASSSMSASYPYNTQFGSPHNDSSSPHSDPSRSIVPTGIFVPASHVITGLPQPARQKGRPRKRKPKDIEPFTANIDLNTEYVDFGRGSHMSSSSRTKRMRTSFKHHQLRTMKSYFAINHNPDAKDLKQLSQKTGLPKRVLQVWFQNARAKWRRMMMKQDGSGILEKGDGVLDLDSISVHSPASFILGGPNTTPPHNLD